MRERISISNEIDSLSEVKNLINQGFVSATSQNGKFQYSITAEGTLLMIALDNFFTKAKKKTDIQLMGKDFNDKIIEYREIFPEGKIPSGKPARQNTKALGEAFRSFFETYDFTWDQIITATKMYVNEYRDKEYLYMMTSQYFIGKQDKNKVKHSELADYCDMIKEGVTTEEKHFNEKVV